MRVLLSAVALAAASLGAQVSTRHPLVVPALAAPAGRLVLAGTLRFQGAVVPAGESNLFRHAFGLDEPGNAAVAAGYGITGRWSAGLAYESRFRSAGLETRVQLLSQPDGSPVSLGLSLNAAGRFDAAVEKDKRWSGGGNLAVQRLLGRWTAGLSLAGQSHTNTDAPGAKPEHTVAWGFALARHGEHVSAFGEAYFPLPAGYRRTYGGRAPDGVAPIALGFSFDTFAGGRLDVLAANTEFSLPANFLAGADAPTRTRLMEWRLGLGYAQPFNLGAKP